jgi:hypothetical protein
MRFHVRTGNGLRLRSRHSYLSSICMPAIPKRVEDRLAAGVKAYRRSKPVFSLVSVATPATAVLAANTAETIHASFSF